MTFKKDFQFYKAVTKYLSQMRSQKEFEVGVKASRDMNRYK